MLLLALDTSGAAVTAAVHDGVEVRAERSVPGERGHAEQLAPLVAAVLAAAGADRRDLTTVAVGVGPGPFTGLRVGLVTARVLGHALGVDVVGVCSLDAVAFAAAAARAAGRAPGAPPSGLLVATDARRREVYWAGYRLEYPEVSPQVTTWRAVRVDGPHVGPPSDVPRDDRPVVGRGALLHADVLLAPGAAPAAAAPLDVGAGVLAELAVRGLRPDADPADRAALLPPEPLYLRRPDAAVPGARKRVLR